MRPACDLDTENALLSMASALIAGIDPTELPEVPPSFDPDLGRDPPKAVSDRASRRAFLLKAQAQFWQNRNGCPRR